MVPDPNVAHGPRQRTKVMLVSAGLGRVARGFETSAAAWALWLRLDPRLEVVLCAGGSHPFSRRVTNLPRSGRVMRVLRRLNLVSDGARLEQLTFGACLLPHLLREKPNVIWTQEFTTARCLLLWRRLLRLRYVVVFCDGAPVGAENASRFDRQIFLLGVAREEAIAEGVVRADRSITLAHVTSAPGVSRTLDKVGSRLLLDLPLDKVVILCVSAWNTEHKRVDAVLHAVSTVGSREVVLLVCGQPEAEGDKLKALGDSLGLSTVWLTLPADQMGYAYGAADIFVHGATSEALGAVLIEAGTYALPVIAHAQPASIEILGDDYPGLLDIEVPGSFGRAIERLVDDTKLRRRWGLLAQSSCDERFDDSASARRLADFLIESTCTRHL